MVNNVSAKESSKISVTVDAVIISTTAPRYILLVKRKNAPFAGQWALPGGFVNVEEDLEAAAFRELREETGIRPDALKQFHAFGKPGRDPRGRTISIAHFGFYDKNSQPPTASDDAKEVKWHLLDHLPELAFDHAQIIAKAMEFAHLSLPGEN